MAENKGAYKRGKPSLVPEQIEKIKEILALGVPKAKLAKEFGVSRQSAYECLG